MVGKILHFRSNSYIVDQILDAANLDTIAYQDELFTSFEGSLVEPKLYASGSEPKFNKDIFLFMKA